MKKSIRFTASGMLATALLSGLPVQAQTCNDRNGQADILWQARAIKVRENHALTHWKASEPKVPWMDFYVFDRLTASADYGDGYSVSADGNGRTLIQENEKATFTWNLKYSIPLGEFRKRTKTGGGGHPHPDKLLDIEIQKARAEFYEKVSDWRIANVELELAKAKARKAIASKDASSAEDLTVQKAQYEADKIAMQIGILAGSPTVPQGCI